jgi:ATP-dependent protease HslVU (ClpYQ) peptidase subunit
MTCIVGISRGGKVWLGGDSAGVDGSHNLSVVTQPKVFRKGEYLIGYTTSFRMGQILEHSVSLPDPPSNDEALFSFMVSQVVEVVRSAFCQAGFSSVINNSHSGGTFLIGVKGRLFSVRDDFAVIEDSSGVAACGCGAAYALGAMVATPTVASVKYILTAGLKAAAKLSSGVVAPFHIMGPA